MTSRAAAKSSSTRAQALDRGRDAFRKQAWGTAYSELLAADREAPLDPEDLALLAQTSMLTGRDAEGADLLARAHQAFLSRGDPQPAVRCAFWLGFTSMLAGEFAKAGGWLSRAGRTLDGQPECVEYGYLLLPDAFRSFQSGDAVTAHARFSEAGAIGGRFHDKDLTTLALQGQGRSLIRQGDITRGVALLDEAMVAVTAGEVSALTAGGIYCSVLDACGEMFDLQRAQEWTSALDHWCASQPDLVPYRGHCLVRRAELLRTHGAWSEALEAAQHAVEWLAGPPPKQGAGFALYVLGDILRLRGKFAESESAYMQASQLSRSQGPGMALLRLAQGRTDAASGMIGRLAEEAQETGARAGILEALIDILLAAGDVPGARAAAQELKEIAAEKDVPYLAAVSSRAFGAVLLAEGDARGAWPELRRSWNLWLELRAPYEAARTQFLIALACRESGDEENALAEFTAARDVFQRLDARTDLARVESALSQGARAGAGPLTSRELQVLKLVASGMTNREIAGKLNISEKTVARHLSNIFTKLDLSSRTAATAYAYDHHLV